MKKYTTLLLIFAARLSFANMASPYGEGTKVSSVFSSREVDILNEKIDVNIDSAFKTASYVIEYNIKTDIDGKQIPLLFYAVNYKSDFKVWVDGKLVQLLNIPSKYTDVANSPFQSFSNSLDSPWVAGQPRQDTIYWQEWYGGSYDLANLKYFEALLKKGNHQVRVAYTAGFWEYHGNWIKQYSFHYSLSPAKFWRSFGKLEVNLTYSSTNGAITTNFDTIAHSTLGNTKTWNFNKLPGDVFVVNYTPSIEYFASFMLFLGPFGIAIIVALFLILLHIASIKRSRRANPFKKYSSAVVFGSILIPFLFFVSYLSSFDIIDGIIGTDASRYHGYVFVVIFLYPIVMPLYWLIMWAVDRAAKKRQLTP